MRVPGEGREDGCEQRRRRRRREEVEAWAQ